MKLQIKRIKFEGKIGGSGLIGDMAMDYPDCKVDILCWVGDERPPRKASNIVGEGHSLSEALQNAIKKVFDLGFKQGQQWKHERLEDLLEQARGSATKAQQAAEELRQEARKLGRKLEPPAHQP